MRGGPLTFNPKLIDVFSERLNLKENERLVPEHPEIMVAYGAALSLNGMFKEADPEASDAPVTFLPLTEWVSPPGTGPGGREEKAAFRSGTCSPALLLLQRGT